MPVPGTRSNEVDHKTVSGMRYATHWVTEAC